MRICVTRIGYDATLERYLSILFEDHMDPPSPELESVPSKSDVENREMLTYFLFAGEPLLTSER